MNSDLKHNVISNDSFDQEDKQINVKEKWETTRFDTTQFSPNKNAKNKSN